MKTKKNLKIKAMFVMDNHVINFGVSDANAMAKTRLKCACKGTTQGKDLKGESSEEHMKELW